MDQNKSHNLESIQIMDKEEEAKNYKRGNRNSNTSLAINWP